MDIAHTCLTKKLCRYENNNWSVVASSLVTWLVCWSTTILQTLFPVQSLLPWSFTSAGIVTTQ